MALVLTLAVAVCLYRANAEPVKLSFDSLGCPGSPNDTSPLLPSGTSLGSCASAAAVNTWRVYACNSQSFGYTDYDNSQCVATYIARDTFITGVCVNDYLTNTSFAYVCDVNDTVIAPSAEVKTSHPAFQNTSSQCSDVGECESSFFYTYYSDNQCQTARSAVNNIDPEMKSGVCYNQPTSATLAYTTSFSCVGNMYVKRSYVGDCAGTILRNETAPTGICRPSGVAYAIASCVNTPTTPSTSSPDAPTPTNNANTLLLSFASLLIASLSLIAL